jgi:hypothetical protein
MKSENRVVFIARDGEVFPTKAQCRTHERKTSGDALVGLAWGQVEAARNGANPELAEAIKDFVNEMRNFERRRNGPESDQAIDLCECPYPRRLNKGFCKDCGRPVSERAAWRRNLTENNGGEKTEPALSDDAGNGRAADSEKRTYSERAGAPQGEGIGLEDGRTEAAP